MPNSNQTINVTTPKPYHYSWADDHSTIDLSNVGNVNVSSSNTISISTGTHTLNSAILNSPIGSSSWSNNAWTQRDNLFHNPYGPAAITKSEAKWYLEGKQYFKTQLFCIDANHDQETTLLWVLTYGHDLPSDPKDVRYIESNFK